MSEKIELYKVRDFGDRVNVVFAFIKQNGKEISKALLYFVPIYLLVAIAMGYATASFAGGMTFGDIFAGRYSPTTYPTDIFAFYTVSILSSLTISLAAYFVSLFVISYTIEYGESEDGVVDKAKVLARVKDSFWGCLGGAILVGIVVVFGFFLCILPGIWLAVSYVFFVPIYIIERTKQVPASVNTCMSESFDLIKQNWFGAFGFVVVMWIISMIFTLILQLPMQITQLAQMLLHEMESLYIVISIITHSIYYVGVLFVSIITHVSVAVLYFDFKERRDGVNLQKRINQIGQTQERF